MIRCVNCDSTDVVRTDADDAPVSHRCRRCGKPARFFEPEPIEPVATNESVVLDEEAEAARPGPSLASALSRHNSECNERVTRYDGGDCTCWWCERHGLVAKAPRLDVAL